MFGLSLRLGQFFFFICKSIFKLILENNIIPESNSVAREILFNKGGVVKRKKMLGVFLVLLSVFSLNACQADVDSLSRPNAAMWVHLEYSSCT